MSRRGRAGGAALLLLVGAVSACRFERRTDLVAEVPATAALYTSPDQPVTPVADSVRAAVVALTAALQSGDPARVALFTTPDAVLIDQEDGVRWTRAGAVPLPRPLPSVDESLEWEMDGVSFALLGDGTALYSCLFTAAVAEGGPWSAVESWVLVRNGAGWRVRYLHRSRGLGPSATR